MLITSKEISRLLRQRFGFWRKTHWQTDATYYAPTLDESLPLIEQAWAELPRALISLNECEEYALHTISKVRLARAHRLEQLPISERRNWPLGMAMGTKFQGHKKNHTVNFLVCSQDGKPTLVLLDGQTKKHWQADEDKIFFTFV